VINASQARLLQDCIASIGGANIGECSTLCDAIRAYAGAGIASVDDESRVLGEVQMVDAVVVGDEKERALHLERHPAMSITISASSRIDVPSDYELAPRPDYFTTRFNSSTRSVRSQEKPP
jgi:hypothetical protein